LVAVKGKHGATLAGRYRLLEQLGEGGMGSVWKAEHLLLHSHVAVKIIDPDIARLEFNLARFLREAKTLATLRSPHVVQVLDFGSDADTPYLVMELLQGQTLGRRLSEQGRLTLGETSRVLQDVCAAMSLVHEQGLIHRDLKPENIFLCNVGGQRVTKVVDFGIAKSLRGEMTTGSMKTRTGHMLGTPSYMSPEQCRGLKDIDHRADLWALGVIAYECLVGKVPFDGQVLGDLLLRICMDPLPIPSQHARGALPAAFDAWFAKAVARDREVRFQSARELATSLSELSPALSVTALSIPALGVPAANSPLREAVEASRPSAPRISFVPPMPVPRPPSNTETNTSVGLVGGSRRVERRARVAALVATAAVAAIGLWAIADKRNADGATNVDVQSLRPPYEVTPKVIRPGVPSGRRWQPGGAGSQGAAGLPSPSDGAVQEGASGPLAAPAADAAQLPSPGSAGEPAGGAAQLSADARSFGAAAVHPVAPTAVPIASAINPPPPSLAGQGAAASAAQPARAPSAGGSAPAGGAAAPPAGSSAAGGASNPPPAAAPPNAPPPRPSYGRQLYPSPTPPAPTPPPSSTPAPSLPLRPLRGTAAPASPGRAHPPVSGDDTIRHTR
jgi:eukaryotic-like serine/threonine-protein kinase